MNDEDQMAIPPEESAPLDLKDFFLLFQDYLAPNLDTYEQAIYLYIFRVGRLVKVDPVVIGFKSAKKRMACGVGEKGKPMSENSVYRRLQSLESKGCISVLKTTHAGKLISLHLPSEIPGLVKAEEGVESESIDEMDFFSVAENRKLLLEREGHKCFYTLQVLDESNFVVDHVVSRPVGDNSYRNLVAASREANNKKGGMRAEDFLRGLFRQGFLNEMEFSNQMRKLSLLASGDLKPKQFTNQVKDESYK